MRKITVFVSSGKVHEIFLKEPVTTLPNSTMEIKNVSVYWKYNNVTKGVNDSMSLSDGTLIPFDPGFWTFDEIKKRVKFHNIDMEKIPHNNTCKIRPDGDDLLLGKFALILGFPEGENLTGDVWESSPHPVNVTRGLRCLKIHCNIVNVFTNHNKDGERSDIAMCFPVTSEQNLNGSMTTYDLESEVSVYNGHFNKLEFRVGSNITKKVDVDVMFDLYVR